MIKQETIDKILNSVRIEEIVKDFVTLKKSGKGFLGHCPFHNEKTPSFSVSPAKGICKCFGCGEGGNVITFIQKHESLTFYEAAKYIAKKNNIPIEETERTEEEIAKSSKKESLRFVTDFASHLYQNNFTKSIGYKYMSERGFSDEILKEFRIGYAIDSWKQVTEAALKKGFKKNIIVESGVCKQNDENNSIYDSFKNRVMFPYLDLPGNVLGFTGRILTDDKEQAKYINSENKGLFDKSKVLYGLHQAKRYISKEDCIYLVEGNTDVMRFHQKEIKNTVASSGTALSKPQVYTLKKLTSNVIFIFDSDNAGEKAAFESINKFIEIEFNVKVVVLPKKEDPDSFAENKKTADILAYIETNKKDFLDYQAHILLKKTNAPKDKSKAVKKISETLALISDDQEREFYKKDLTKKFKLDKNILDKNIIDLREKIEIKPSKLFAFEYAEKSIKEKDYTILLANNETVILNHQSDIKNTVGFSVDTEFSEFKKLKKLTQNLTFSDCLKDDSFIKDEEETKLLKLIKSLAVLGFDIELTFNDEDFREPVNISFVDLYIKLLAKNINPGSDKSKKAAIEKAAEIISFLSETERMLKIKFAIAEFNIRGYEFNATDFKKILSSYLKKNERVSTKEITIYADNPHGLSQEQLESQNKYGFYEKENQLYFSEKTGGAVKYSNYTIKPLFHIASINQTRKLFELTNFKDENTIIEVDIESMVKLDKWQVYCESKGNYLFWGNKTHFLRIKQKLYDTTKYCYVIENLGWQKDGFWAWADGVIYKKKFIPVDEFGIVTVKDKNYYIPAFSNLYKDDKTVFKNERKFVRKSQDISFYDWSTKFISVYGNNAKLSICALLTAVFSDYIFSVAGSLPLINFFGVKGTGKTEHAISLLNFFGERQNVLNIHKGTEYAAAVHLENFKNAFALIDEYKNTLDIKKIEYLKGIYNRDGRLRGSIKAGVKTETTQVNSMVLLCGQEMPTADVALFSRLVFLAYYNPEFTQEQKDKYNDLKALEKHGLTHLTEELLQYREIIENEYEQSFYEVEKKLSDQLPPSIDGRLIKNYTTIITLCKILEKYIKLSFSYQDTFDLSIIRIMEQYKIMNTSNEVNSFWESLISLIERGIITEGENYKLQEELSVKLKVMENGKNTVRNFDFDGTAKNILYLKMSTVYSYYAEHAIKIRQEIMPKKSLEYYLMHSKAFIGTKNPCRFRNTTTTGWAFDYKQLTDSGIDLLKNDDKGNVIKTTGLEDDEVDGIPVEDVAEPTQTEADFKEDEIPN